MDQHVRVRALLLVCSVVIIATLTACGGNVAITTQPPRPSPTATVPNESRDRDCGTVQTRGLDTVNEPSAQRSEDCIWQAYQQCATIGMASLTIHAQPSPEREISTTWDFTLQGNGGGCTIQETKKEQVFLPAVRAASPNPPTITPTGCAGLTRDPNGTLHFLACGKDGEIIVAPPKP